MQKGHVSAIAHSKSTKETQEEAVKHAQSQQYRHQGRATSFTLICCHKSLTLYPFHALLQFPHFQSKQTNAKIVGIS